MLLGFSSVSKEGMLLNITGPGLYSCWDKQKNMQCQSNKAECLEACTVYPIVRIKYCSLREHDKNLETKSTLANLLHLHQGNTSAGQVTSLLGRSPEQTR